MAKWAKGVYKLGILAGVVAEVQRVIGLSSGPVTRQDGWPRAPQHQSARQGQNTDHFTDTHSPAYDC